jgi:prepilin signal peptidase PulO-like enzyme (type II secretory pathway)
VGGGLFYVLFQMSGGRWIGGGDVKLGFLLGLVVGGPMEAVMVLFLSSLLGVIAILPLLAAKKASRKSLIPYGPFLIIAAIVIQLFGAELTLDTLML